MQVNAGQRMSTQVNAGQRMSYQGWIGVALLGKSQLLCGINQILFDAIGVCGWRLGLLSAMFRNSGQSFGCSFLLRSIRHHDTK